MRYFIKPFPNIKIDGSCDFHLWAPNAKSAFIDLNTSEVLPMERINEEYFHLNIENAEGLRYKYRIDDNKSFPDPGSLYQPDGVHEHSEVFPLSRHKWNDSKWQGISLNGMIIYELHTGTFTPGSNFNGIEKKLDYLLELGINTIELMPVAQFPGKRNWGYDGVYPFAVQNSYGGPGGLMELVDTCHSKGIALILDVVYNHFGPEGNYVGNFAPYFSERYTTPWGSPINFDGPYSDGVRNYFVQNALMWLRDFHIDGLRLDAIHSIFDFSAKHIMAEISEKVRELEKETGRKYQLIAESNLNDVRYINPAEKGGYALDAQWSDDFHHVVHSEVTGERNGYYIDFGGMDMIVKSFKDFFVYDGAYSKFRKKTFGNSTTGCPAEQFIIFIQNHDQVGNRRFGERLSSLVSFDMLKAVAGAMFLAPNVPMLFMGEEYGEKNPFQYFVSHNDPELNRLVREGRDREFRSFLGENPPPAPDPASEETFNDSRLSYAFENNNYAKEILNWYKWLIRLKKEHPVLKQADRLNMEVKAIDKLLIIQRKHGNDILLGMVNFGEKDARYKWEKTQELMKIADSRGPNPKGIVAGTNHTLGKHDEILVEAGSCLIYSSSVI
ncbi:MAG: malto-oligosyltrehalose trehalohydrolase [Candidatus Kapaibacterium sp.]